MRKRTRKCVKRLQKYMAAYTKQVEFHDITNKTLIDDVLYGLGVALGPKRYEFNNGFRLFKARLLKHLQAKADTAINRGQEGDTLPVRSPSIVERARLSKER